MADQTRIKIEESLKNCLANLPTCQTIKELAVPAELMIRQVTALIRPDCDVQFTPLKKDPQEIENAEESKEEASLDVKFWMNELEIAIKERSQDILNQIKEIEDNRAVLVKSFDRMNKFNLHSSQLQKQIIDSFQTKIKEFQNEGEQHQVLKLTITKEVIEKIKKAIQEAKKNITKSKLATRYNAPYLPIILQQNLQFPLINSQSFDNYLVAIQNCGTFLCNFNFRFKQGDKTELKSTVQLREIKIQPERTEIKRAVIEYSQNSGKLYYIELFDKDNRKLLEAGPPFLTRINWRSKTHEIVLEMGERIIGFKSRNQQDNSAIHYDFQFLLGKLY